MIWADGEPLRLLPEMTCQGWRWIHWRKRLVESRRRGGARLWTEQLISKLSKSKYHASLYGVWELTSCQTPTFLCAFRDANGCSEQGGTYKNIKGLIPVGNQHQSRSSSPYHSLLWADWMFPLRLLLLNQVDTPRFAANNGVMKGHGGWHHLRIRDVFCKNS